MKTLLAAVVFLTRVPVPARWCFDAPDVGRAAVFFPLVGAAIGGIGVLGLKLLSVRVAWGEVPRFGGPWLPPALTALCLVSLTAWVTRGLHLDGLADMADGFGGGRSREDVLRIMREPSLSGASCPMPAGKVAWERRSPIIWGVLGSSAPPSWRRRSPFSSALWPPLLAGERRSQ
jgi:cobalamin synthase